VSPALPGDGPDLLPVGSATLIGTVLEFDDPRGVGMVGCGDRYVPFHCTAITDGSRHIDVGTVVAIRIGPARLGRVEARSVRPLPGVHAAGTLAVDGDRPGAHSRRPHDDDVAAAPVSAALPVPPPSPPDPPVPPAVESWAPVESSPPEAVDVIPQEATPPESAPPDSATGSVPPEAPGPAPGSASPSWSDVGATPVSGTPVVPSDPSTGPSPSFSGAPFTAPAPVAGSPGASGTGAGASSGTGAGDDSDGGGDGDVDESSPRPNFWSPFSRSPTGPPPTWSTPVTPRRPPADGS